jgi:hypothetical protein
MRAVEGEVVEGEVVEEVVEEVAEAPYQAPQISKTYSLVRRPLVATTA